MAHNSSASPPPSTTAATEPICAGCSILPEAHERRHAHLPTLGYSRLPMSVSVFDVLACLVIVAAAGCSSRLADCFLVDSPWPRSPLRLLVRVQASCFFRVARLNGCCPGGEPNPVRFNLMATSSDIRREQQGIALLCIVLADVCVYPPGVGVIAWSLRLISTGWWDRSWGLRHCGRQFTRPSLRICQHHGSWRPRKGHLPAPAANSQQTTERISLRTDN